MKAFLKGLLAFLVVGICVGLVGGFLWLLVSWFLRLDSNVQGPLLAFVGLLLVPVVTYFTQRSLERRRSLETSLREHKTKLYSEMIQGMLRMAGVGGQSMTPDEMMQFMGSITPALMTYGSSGVIQAWVKMRMAAVANDEAGTQDSASMVWSLEGILKAMRQDLGHSGRMSDGALLRVFINDVDDMIAAKASAAKQAA